MDVAQMSNVEHDDAIAELVQVLMQSHRVEAQS
jgi:hypothetical protein